MPQVSIKELKDALKLFDLTITAWSKTLRHPQTGESISRSAIYRAIDEGRPSWIIDEIRKVITKARREFPDYYRKKNSLSP